MEALIALAVGFLTGSGIYLVLQLHSFPVVLGLTLLSYGVNLFLFASGRLVAGLPPILHAGARGYADPLPQALVLTAIVISFGMTAVLVMMALGTWLETGDDRIDGDENRDGGQGREYGHERIERQDPIERQHRQGPADSARDGDGA